MSNTAIRNIITNSLLFIQSEQLPWGEIANYTVMPRDDNEEIVQYRSSVFLTAAVINALLQIKSSSTSERIIHKGIQFLLNSKEDHTWRYFGPDSELPPDTDTTSQCYSILYQFKYYDTEITDILLENRDEQSRLFNTWIGYSPIKTNDQDSVVNANIFHLFCKMNSTDLIPETENYLLREVRNLHTQHSQTWYYSPIMFCYILSRIISTGKSVLSDNLRREVIRYLIFSQRESGSWGNSLNTALAATSLLECEYEGDKVENAIEWLINNRKTEYSWKAEFIFPFGGDGSDEITTAFCTESLAKYLESKQ